MLHLVFENLGNFQHEQDGIDWFHAIAWDYPMQFTSFRVGFPRTIKQSSGSAAPRFFLFNPFLWVLGT